LGAVRFDLGAVRLDSGRDRDGFGRIRCEIRAISVVIEAISVAIGRVLVETRPIIAFVGRISKRSGGDRRVVAADPNLTRRITSVAARIASLTAGQSSSTPP
jgi:hypothetical protein